MNFNANKVLNNVYKMNNSDNNEKILNGVTEVDFNFLVAIGGLRVPRSSPKVFYVILWLLVLFSFGK